MNIKIARECLIKHARVEEFLVPTEENGSVEEKKERGRV